MLPRIAKDLKIMHWLQMFLLGWLSFGLTTVLLMFWLCKRTAAGLNDPVKTIPISPQRAEFSTKKLSSELRSA